MSTKLFVCRSSSNIYSKWWQRLVKNILADETIIVQFCNDFSHSYRIADAVENITSQVLTAVPFKSTIVPLQLYNLIELKFFLFLLPGNDWNYSKFITCSFRLFIWFYQISFEWQHLKCDDSRLLLQQLNCFNKLAKGAWRRRERKKTHRQKNKEQGHKWNDRHLACENCKMWHEKVHYLH